MLTVLHKLPAAQALLHALYHCRYAEFFPAFLRVVAQLEADHLAAPHARFFMREARATVYAQYLASYKAVKLPVMAAAFGVGPQFLDREACCCAYAGSVVPLLESTVALVTAVQCHCVPAVQRLLLELHALLLSLRLWRARHCSRIVFATSQCFAAAVARLCADQH